MFEEGVPGRHWHVKVARNLLPASEIWSEDRVELRFENHITTGAKRLQSTDHAEAVVNSSDGEGLLLS